MTDHDLTEQSLDNNKILVEPNHLTDTINASYLQSQLLIAMPDLKDPHFKQSVTLICEHNEEGSFGLTINRPSDSSVYDILKQIPTDLIKTSDGSDHLDTELYKSKKVVRGGPVKSDHGFVIHNGAKKWDNTLAITKDLSVTLSKDILLDIIADKGPEKYLFTLGCASWVKGQIESEFINNSWLNCPIDNTIIFDMPFEKRWQGAADLLGINMHTISMESGHD